VADALPDLDHLPRPVLRQPLHVTVMGCHADAPGPAMLAYRHGMYLHQVSAALPS